MVIDPFEAQYYLTCPNSTGYSATFYIRNKVMLGYVPDHELACPPFDFAL
jgi:hypothetical protein